MRNCKKTWLLLAGMTFACGAYAGEPAGVVDSGMSGRIKAIDPITGKTRQPTAAEVTALRMQDAKTKAPALSTRMPKTQAEAARMITILPNGAERLPASEDTLSTLVQTRQADGSFVITHGDADGHAVAQEEKASE